MEKQNCLICGKPLEYLTVQKEMICSICGKPFMSNAACSEGHFVCDQCHSRKGLEAVEQICLGETSKDPIGIIQKIMENPYIYMHGPEHHVMVGASLLTAYKNAGGTIDLPALLKEMMQRGGQVPGGACGFWGCCGAAVSCGIFFSLIRSATPLSKEERGEANRATAKALMRIAKYGGPRCCKRDSFLSILSAAEILQEQTGIGLECLGRPVRCTFSAGNAQCLGNECPFFQNTGKSESAADF